MRCRSSQPVLTIKHSKAAFSAAFVVGIPHIENFLAAGGLFGYGMLFRLNS
jgi:hypothetical protein